MMLIVTRDMFNCSQNHTTRFGTKTSQNQTHLTRLNAFYRHPARILCYGLVKLVTRAMLLQFSSSFIAGLISMPALTLNWNKRTIKPLFCIIQERSVWRCSRLNTRTISKHTQTLSLLLSFNYKSLSVVNLLTALVGPLEKVFTKSCLQILKRFSPYVLIENL